MSPTSRRRPTPSLGLLTALEERVTPALFGLPAAYSDLGPPVANGTLLRAVAVADFNRDGNPDLAGMRDSGEVTAFLNDGTGRFSASALIPALTAGVGYSISTNLEVGDFDADGDQDLLAFQPSGSASDYVLRLHHGNGAGGFDTGVTLPGVKEGGWFLVGDLSGDRADDVVAATNAGFTVLLGQPGGEPVQVDVPGPGSIGNSVLLADVTRDGFADLITNPEVYGPGLAHEMLVYPGVGDGSFGPPVSSLLPETYTGRQDGSLHLQTATDLTGDEAPDLVAVVRTRENTDAPVAQVVLLEGRGDGSFGPPSLLPTEPFATPYVPGDSGIRGFVRSGDFDADGKTDVVVGANVPTSNFLDMPNSFRTEFRVLYGDGAGGFPRQQLTSAIGAVVADFDRDGRADLAGTYANGEQGLVTVFLSSHTYHGTVAAAASGTTLRALVPDGGRLAVDQYGIRFTNQPTVDRDQAGERSRAFFNQRVATAEITGDGVADLIGVRGPGDRPTLLVSDGVTEAQVAAFNLFEGTFTGGLFVAAADMDGDGKAEVVVCPDQGGGPVAVVYSGAKLAAGLAGDAAQIVRFFGIDDPSFRGGARPALGDVTGDGKADLIVSAGFLGGPRVTIWDGASILAGIPRQVANFFAFESSLRNGAFVTAGDVTGDGVAEVAFGGGPGGAPRVRVFDGEALLAAGTFTFLDEVPSAQVANFFAGDASQRGGVRLALRDAAGDGTADLLAGSGEGEPSRIRVFLGPNLLANAAPAADQELDPFGGAVLAGGVFVG
jgi:hypothetical protein